MTEEMWKINYETLREQVEELGPISDLYFVGQKNSEIEKILVCSDSTTREPYWVNCEQDDQLLNFYIQQLSTQENKTYEELIEDRRIHFVPTTLVEKMLRFLGLDQKEMVLNQMGVMQLAQLSTLFMLLRNRNVEADFYFTTGVVSNFLFQCIALSSVFVNAIYLKKQIKEDELQSTFGHQFDFSYQNRGRKQLVILGTAACLLGSAFVLRRDSVIREMGAYATNRVNPFTHEGKISPIESSFLKSALQQNKNLIEKERTALEELIPIIQDNPCFDVREIYHKFSTLSTSHHLEEEGVDHYDPVTNQVKLYNSFTRDTPLDLSKLQLTALEVLGGTDCESFDTAMRYAIARDYLGMDHLPERDLAYITVLAHLVGSDTLLEDYGRHDLSQTRELLSELDPELDPYDLLRPKKNSDQGGEEDDLHTDLLKRYVHQFLKREDGFYSTLKGSMAFLDGEISYSEINYSDYPCLLKEYRLKGPMVKQEESKVAKQKTYTRF